MKTRSVIAVENVSISRLSFGGELEDLDQTSNVEEYGVARSTVKSSVCDHNAIHGYGRCKRPWESDENDIVCHSILPTLLKLNNGYPRSKQLS